MCWYTNADTLTNKIDGLRSRINLSSPDIICISEVFPKNCLYSVFMVEFHIEYYDCFFLNSNIIIEVFVFMSALFSVLRK